ncbi:MAG: redoxin domain-containing protein [Gemmatimonadales bacterium]
MERNKFKTAQAYATSLATRLRNAAARLGRHVPTILLAISCVAIALLTRHTHELRVSFLDHRRRETEATRGDYLPTFVARTTTGDSVVIGKLDDSTARQVVFIMTSTCPYCRKTIPSWRRIASRLSGSPTHNIAVLALTPDSARNAKWFGDFEKFAFPLVIFPDRKLVALSRATVVPQTLVLNSDGRVLYSKTGEITSKLMEDSVVSEALRQVASPITTGNKTRPPSINGGARPAS